MSVTAQCGAEQDHHPKFSERVEGKLVEACVRVRTQVSGLTWWEGLRDEEQNRLGGSFKASWEALGTIGMWMRLHRCRSQPRAILELAREIGLLTDVHYRWLDREVKQVDPFATSDPESLIEDACERCRLVLARDGRRCLAYWDGERVGEAWEAHPKKWALLWKLAEAASRRSVVRWDDLCHNPGELANQKHRLTELLPPELAERVRWVRGDDSGYELKLSAEEICLLDFSSEDVLMLPD